MKKVRVVARVGLAATAATVGLVASGAVLSPASADTPTKVAWWNFAAGGGQAAPSPSTPAGGIRVSVTSQQTLAFGAVEYSLARDASATLELPVAQMSSANGQMLNTILACPTKDDSWKAGDDQDASTAPSYDCDVHHYVGRLSSDGKTMTFLVDGTADITDGVLSLAIVPEHTTQMPVTGVDPGTGTDVTPPFFIDFAKPAADSLTQTGGSSAAAPPPPPPPPATTPVTSGSTSGTSGTTTAAPPSLPAAGSVNVPAGGDTGQTPVVAGQTPASTGGIAPQAAVRPVSSGNDWKHNLLLILLIAVGFGFLYLQMQTQGRGGPRSLLAARGPGAGPGTADAAAATLPAYGAARGLGRFAKPRNGSARPLI